jgi:hypothetical protein
VIVLFKSYFTIFDEDSLRNNFVLIYELLDGASLPRLLAAGAALTRRAVPTEIMDNGYPQILAPEALKLYITQEGVRSELAPFEVQARPRPGRAARVRRVLARPLLTRAAAARDGVAQRDDAGHRRGELAPRGAQVQEERGVPGHRRVHQRAHDRQGCARLPRTRRAAGADPAAAAGVVLRSDVSGKIQMKCFLTVRAAAARRWRCKNAAHSHAAARRACRS